LSAALTSFRLIRLSGTSATTVRAPDHCVRSSAARSESSRGCGAAAMATTVSLHAGAANALGGDSYRMPGTPHGGQSCRILMILMKAALTPHRATRDPRRASVLQIEDCGCQRPRCKPRIRAGSNDPVLRLRNTVSAPRPRMRQQCQAREEEASQRYGDDEQRRRITASRGRMQRDFSIAPLECRTSRRFAQLQPARHGARA
jgi:hypothetical protein